MKEEQRLRVGPEGGFPPASSGYGPASWRQVTGTYGKLVGKRLRGWLSLVGSGDR